MAIPQPSRPSVATLPQGAPAIAISGADVSPLGSEDPVNLPLRPPFVLVHYPLAYEAVQLGGRWVIVPRLDRFDLVPGVAHVQAAQQGRPNADRTADAFAALRSQGAIILTADQHPVTDPAHLPPGVAPGRYSRMLRVRDARSGLEGQHWHEVWEVHTLTRAGMAKTYDKAAYARWRLYLIASGVIEAPPAEVAEAIVDAAAEKVRRIRGDAQLAPDQRGERTQAAAADLAALRRDLIDGETTAPATAPSPTPPSAPPAKGKGKAAAAEVAAPPPLPPGQTLDVPVTAGGEGA